MYTVVLFGHQYEVNLQRGQYAGGSLALTAESAIDGPVATVSVNLPESADLPDRCFYGKHWSENASLLEQLVEQGAIVPRDDLPTCASGYVSGIRAYELPEEDYFDYLAARAEYR